MTAREQRRLSAIFMLDVCGYSRLMAEDESGTLERVLTQRRQLIEPLISYHEGRVVKLMGDGILAEFSSVTMAVKCADAIQRSLSRQLRETADPEPIRLRIGIHLGEVIVDGDDIYGDGVNVAARIEPLAQPGGIALSGAAYEQIRHKGDHDFADGGTHQVKNIPEPVPVYHLMQEGVAPPKGAATVAPGPPAGGGRWRLAVLGVAAACVVGAAWWGMKEDLWPGAASADPVRDFDPDRPAVVVLPFDNLTGVAGRGHLGDGITEGVITDLSRVGGLLVIARDTSFAMRSQTPDMEILARDLGVSFVVSGSVQQIGDSLRIHTTVTDAGSGYQLWAEKLDGAPADLFDLQDRVTAMVVDALKLELSEGEAQVLAARDTDNLSAFGHFLKARNLSVNARAPGRSILSNEEQRAERLDQLSEKVGEELHTSLELDPGFAGAETFRLLRVADPVRARFGEFPAIAVGAGQRADKLLEQGRELPQLYSVRSVGALMERKPEQALSDAQSAVIAMPSFADGFALLGWVHHFAGDLEAAEASVGIARRLNPAAAAGYAGILTEIHFAQGRYDDAIRAADTALADDPRSQRVRLYRLAALGLAGRFDEASALAPTLDFATGAGFAEELEAATPYADPEIRAALIRGLRLAGLSG